MPFRDPNAGNLSARIEAGVRGRLEEQVDATCVEAMVRAHEARGLPAPQADSAQDREEYDARVRGFLELLHERVAGSAGAETQAVIEQARERAGQDPLARLTAVQLALARTLPDYWQRFDDARLGYIEQQTRSGGRGSLEEPPLPSSSQRRGLLGRLLGGR